MEATGCATAGAIYTCGTAQNPRERPQVLPAYGLQDLRNNHQDPKTKSHPNTMRLPITLGENHGSGHFYLAKNRTFLLCVDTSIQLGIKRAGQPTEQFVFRDLTRRALNAVAQARDNPDYRVVEEAKRAISSRRAEARWRAAARAAASWVKVAASWRSRASFAPGRTSAAYPA